MRHGVGRIVRHLWMDEDDLRHALPEDLLARLQARITSSERLHTGEIRVYAEAGLPWRYLWRGAPARERALAMFGKLRVWDTEDNNGVLIYLLLADHAIEIVADRGLARQVPAEDWQAIVAGMGEAFRAGRHEEGLVRAIDTVTALLQQHCPATTGQAPRNELPDAPLLGE